MIVASGSRGCSLLVSWPSARTNPCTCCVRMPKSKSEVKRLKLQQDAEAHTLSKLGTFPERLMFRPWTLNLDVDFDFDLSSTRTTGEGGRPWVGTEKEGPSQGTAFFNRLPCRVTYFPSGVGRMIRLQFVLYG